MIHPRRRFWVHRRGQWKDDDHGGHPRNQQQAPGATLPLWQSVLASWVVRGSRSWTLATKGALALHLPYLVADAEDQEVGVTVGLGGAESWGDVIVGAECTDRGALQGLQFQRRIKRRVGTSWGLSPELKAPATHIALTASSGLQPNRIGFPAWFRAHSYFMSELTGLTKRQPLGPASGPRTHDICVSQEYLKEPPGGQGLAG